jgi:threonine dehydrogenase-like Zn-dependent dehydrogenase
MSNHAKNEKPPKADASGKNVDKQAGRRRSGSAVESDPADQTGRTAPGSAEMTAMVLRTDRSIGLERRPVPIPRDDQVLVDVDLCGICGSDLHAPQSPEVYLGGFIMGHEPVGRIARVGRDVTGWHVGQRVCINPNGYTCGVCDACRSGRLNHCIPATLERAIGLQADGALAAQVAVSPKTLHAVPDEMGRIESAWVEPAATALRAVMFAGDLAGRSVLVVGGGPIGQMCCRLARHFGAGWVWLSEPSAERRRYSEASQVDRAFDPSVDAAALEGLKADAVLECSGSEPGFRAALAAAKPEGTVVVVGGGRAGLDPLTILVKELRVLGCFTYVDEFTEVISLLTDGALQVADLTSEIAGIDDAPAAFERLRDASTMKIFIAPNGS